MKMIESKIIPGFFSAAVLLPRGQSILRYPRLMEGSEGLGKGSDLSPSKMMA